MLVGKNQETSTACGSRFIVTEILRSLRSYEQLYGKKVRLEIVVYTSVVSLIFFPGDWRYVK